jgi:hypothetical protein
MLLHRILELLHLIENLLMRLQIIVNIYLLTVLVATDAIYLNIVMNHSKLFDSYLLLRGRLHLAIYRAMILVLGYMWWIFLLAIDRVKILVYLFFFFILRIITLFFYFDL